jgi:hypothetical protein
MDGWKYSGLMIVIRDLKVVPLEVDEALYRAAKAEEQELQTGRYPSHIKSGLESIFRNWVGHDFSIENVRNFLESIMKKPLSERLWNWIYNCFHAVMKHLPPLLNSCVQVKKLVT